ncbi:excitatory amino acid transporter isoform X2 [Ischnura elegans]|nr:excitatory amino acid transporter isoform X2 [Ischnura elegans]
MAEGGSPGDAGGGGGGSANSSSDTAAMTGEGSGGRRGIPVNTRRIRAWMVENALFIVTLSGVFFGVIFGFGLRPLELPPDTIMLISYPGELFMRILKLMILPLIIASLIAGSASLNARMNGKIALRTMVYFLATSLFNSVLGIILVLIIHPGDLGTREALGHGTEDREVNILDGFLDLGRNIFPDNLFQAAFQQAHTVYVPKKVIISNATSEDEVDVNKGIRSAHHIETVIQPDIELVRSIQYREGTNTLGIIFFCLVFGTILGTMGKKARVVIDFFTTIDEVIMRMVTGVMWLTPIGISSVICGKIISVDNLSLVMSQLGWFIFTVVLGVFIYQLVFMQLIYFVFVRKNPFKFYCGLAPATITAFATASTAAALPVTFRCMDEKVKVDPRISRFILPIGATVNMDGTALFVSVASIFIAQINDIPLGFGELATVCLTSTAASIASASVPSAALVLMLIVLTAIDAPVRDVSLLFAIDWFVDRVRTTNNMLGDCYAAAVVEQLSRRELAVSSSAASPGSSPSNTTHFGAADCDDPERGLVKPEANGHVIPMRFQEMTEREPEVVVLEIAVSNGRVKH